MKRKIMAAAALMLSAVAFAQSDKAFEVRVNIKGLTSNIVYPTFFGQEEAKRADKQEVKDGTFTISGELSDYSVLRLSFNQKDFLKMVDRGYIPVKSSNLWVIVSPGSKLAIEGSLEGKDFIDLYPTGDFENSAMSKLTSKLMPVLNESANYSLELAKNQELTEVQKNILQDKMEVLGQKAETVKLEFLNTSYNSVAALWLMEDMLIRSEIDPLKLASVIDKVDKKKYGSSYFYKAVKQRVEGAKGTGVGCKCPVVESDETPDGKQFSIENLKGKYVIIDFWGTWCGPCMSGMPHMKSFRDKHAGKLEIVGIAKDRNKEIWKKAIADNGMSWIHIFNGKGERDFVAKFNVQGYPTKILISPDGKILYRESGEKEEFYSEVEKLMK